MRLVGLAEWPFPWYYRGRTESLDAIGRRRKSGGRTWLVFECSSGSAKCPAQLLVEADSILYDITATRR